VSHTSVRAEPVEAHAAVRAEPVGAHAAVRAELVEAPVRYTHTARRAPAPRACGSLGGRFL